MLDLDTNAITANQVPIVAATQTVAETRSPGGSDRPLTTCQDVQSGDTTSAFNDIGVVQGVLGALGYSFDKIKGQYAITADEFRRIADRVSVVAAPKHGSLAKVEGQYPLWHYVPTEGYAGKDHASFVVQWKGQRVFVTWNLWVKETVNERQDGHYDCSFVKFEQAPSN